MKYGIILATVALLTACQTDKQYDANTLLKDKAVFEKVAAEQCQRARRDTAQCQLHRIVAIDKGITLGPLWGNGPHQCYQQVATAEETVDIACIDKWLAHPMYQKRYDR